MKILGKLGITAKLFLVLSLGLSGLSCQEIAEQKNSRTSDGNSSNSDQAAYYGDKIPLKADGNSIQFSLAGVPIVEGTAVFCIWNPDGERIICPKDREEIPAEGNRIEEFIFDSETTNFTITGIFSGKYFLKLSLLDRADVLRFQSRRKTILIESGQTTQVTVDVRPVNVGTLVIGVAVGDGD